MTQTMTDSADTSAGSRSPQAVVEAFLASWQAGDVERIMSYLAPDAVYHNVPVDPIVGEAGIREIFSGFTKAFASSHLETLNIATNGNTVLTERVDHFVMHDGSEVHLPVSGTFVVIDGLITRFSDYFDLADFERQSGLKL